MPHAEEMPPSAEAQAAEAPPTDFNDEELSEERSDDSGANDKIRPRRNATRYALSRGPANPRLERQSTGFEAEATRSKYSHDDFTSTNF